MKDQNENELTGAVCTTLSIADRMFNLWFPKGDSYLNSQEALNARIAEASLFKSTCKQLIRDLNVDSTACLDVGANLGLTSLVLGQLSYVHETLTPISKIVSFEPEPLTFRCMKKNTEIFSDLITPVNSALGTRSGSLSFLKTPGSTSASHVVTENHFIGISNEVVNVERLDYYVEKLALSHVGFIKIDVEGYEMAVLQGAIGTIEKFNPQILMEFNSWALIAFSDINPREFLSFLLDCFQIVCRVNKVSGILEPIRSKDEALTFLHNNLVINDCVDDLVLRLRQP